MTSRRRESRDEPFAASLLGGRGEPGRRQAERLTHRDGSVHLARLEQALGGFAQVPLSLDRRTGSRVSRRLVLEGSPVFRSVSDSRLAADRWERVMLDGFVANQLVGYLLRRRAQRV